MSFNSSLSLECNFSGKRVVHILSAFNLTKILLLLPLYLLVLYLGRQWRRERSSASVSHSDLITYHMFAIEMIALLSGILFFFGSYIAVPAMMDACLLIFNMTYPGQMLLHVLTCVERYLAVVHPITYVGLKSPCGVRIRNISIGCVWLLGFGWVGLTTQVTLEIPLFCLSILSLIVTSYCSLSVLCTLWRPGPGEVGRDRERVDRSKRRAFYTIVVITGMLLMWVVGLLINTSLSKSKVLSHSDYCVVLAAGLWFCLPSSFVLPLLFLHRAGKLQCCC